MAMSVMFFHNQTLDMNRAWYESHKALIMNLCIELDCMNRLEEFTTKFLGKPLKIKKIKDPLKPKRTKSAFFFFCEEKRPDLMDEWRKKTGKVNVGEISKKLGSMWQALENKEKYYSLNKDDKARYQQEMEVYKN